MDIQLIALDLDRTTLNSQGKLSKTNYNALSQAIKNGVHVCIASGRAFDTLPSDVLSVPGIEYAITSNGAAVYNIKTKERIKSYLLTENAIDIIMNICKKYPVTYEAFINGVAYTGKEYIDNPDKFGATQHSIDYVLSTRTLKDDIVGFIYENKNRLDCIDIIVNNDELKNTIINEIKTATNEVYITSSIKQLIEISYKDAGKKSGLEFLSNYLNISRENIAAFGDADNDFDMIKYAGVGIAMENASSHLLEVADYTTLHHDNDGVAYAFKNIIKVC
jgi:Cof subfamily protein (haloacid dehalogenase superfamily)